MTRARLNPAVWALVVLAAAEAAAWLPDGVSVCTAEKPQITPRIVADGSGGVFVAWLDARADSTCPPQPTPHSFCRYDVFVQHLTRAGEVAAGWPENGLPVCVVSADKSQVQMISDQAGGVILAWVDKRVYLDIYAQRIIGSGKIAPGWQPEGVPVCNAEDAQIGLACIPDGSGGAYLAWVDYRLTSMTTDIFAQHLLGNGTIAPGWPADGMPISVAAGNQFDLALALDGSGGLILVWADERNLPGRSIYGLRVTAGGSIVDEWQPNGKLLSAGHFAQFTRMLPDGAGGALVAWVDADTTSNDYVIVAQRVTGVGDTAPGWPALGIAMAHEVTNNIRPMMTPDDHGNAIVAWPHWILNGTTWESDIRALHLRGDGSLDPAWPANGLSFCSASGNQGPGAVSPDTFGGALVAWADGRSGATEYDIYVQRINDTGEIASGWPADGLAVCTAPRTQGPVGIALDGAGGAVVTWSDQRNGVDDDVYAQRVGLAGGVPSAIEAVDGIRGKRWEAFPNPFGSTTRLAFTTPVTSNFSLDIFDVSGRFVKRLARGSLAAGTHTYLWDGLDATGVQLAPGVYIVRAKEAGRVTTHKIVRAH